MRYVLLLLLLTTATWAQTLDLPGLKFKMPAGYQGSGVPLTDKLWSGQWRDAAHNWNLSIIATRLDGDARKEFTAAQKASAGTDVQQAFEQPGAVGAFMATPKGQDGLGAARKVVIFSPTHSYVFTFIAMNKKDVKELEAQIRQILSSVQLTAAAR